MNSDKKFFSKIGFTYLIYVILTIILTTILGNIISIINPEILNNINATTIIVAICNYILPLPILIFLLKKIDSTNIEKHNLNIKTYVKYLCITIALMWIGNIIGITITGILSGATQSEISNPIHDLINSTGIWLNILLISIIGPVFEEFIFRKLLIDRTIKYGARVSIILSAVMFALIHGNLNQFCYTILVGGFFAYVYIKTGKLRYTITLHMILNLIGSVLALFLNQSIKNLSSGSIATTDIFIVALYFALMIIILFIGIISLLDYKKAKFNDEKTEIKLKNPLKIMFLNVGMICFILFLTIQIIQQAIG